MAAATSLDQKGSTSRVAYKPDLYTGQEVAEFPWVFRSKNYAVYILSIAKDLEGTYLKGFVESESRNGFYHYAVVLVGQNKGIVGGGFCECESRHYYGKPCKHVASLRNMYIKHREELGRLASTHQDIRR